MLVSVITLKLRRAAVRGAVAIGVALVLLMPASVAAATTVRFVDDDGKGSATGCAGSRSIPDSIQAAVDQSAAGDLIIVCPGTYVGPVHVDVPRLTIRSRDPWMAIVAAGPNHQANSPLITVENARGVKIKWLQLVARTTGPCAMVGSMVLVSNAPETEVRANHIGIAGNAGLGACGFAVGVRVQDSSASARVVFNRVTDFQAAGLLIGESRDVIALGNTVSYRHAGYPAGVYGNSTGIHLYSAVTGVRIRANVVEGIRSGGHSTPTLVTGILITETPALIKDNTIRRAAQVIVVLSVQGGRIISNTARRGLQAGIGINSSEGTLIRGNLIHAPDNGISVGPSTAGLNIRANDFDGPSINDCWDTSTGSGTQGTANIWADNIGTSAIPPGICKPD